jgi:acetyl-CoA C-acetyltransferase
MGEVFILDYCRTPIGSFMGSLANFTAVELGSLVCRELINKITSQYPGFDKNQIQQVFFGNVISAGLGQNIARQISKNAGIEAPSVTINMVCGSGMESIHQGYKSILVGEADVVLVGGTESMSNAPYLNKSIRKGNKFGNISVIDSILSDGLTDAFGGKHMGELTEETNLKYNITREMQDTYAKMSYSKARDALSQGKYANEIVAINVGNGKSDNVVIGVDEEINKVPDLAKLTSLKPAFSKSGTITPGNASKLNDGASAMILVSKRFIEEMGLRPVARIMGFDISVGDPAEFSRIPILSINRILSKLNITHDQVDLYEINEAFSSVPIMFHHESTVAYEKINIYGGAVALGHPIGSSGSRIVGTLISALHNENKLIGCASICNGGGGAISMILQKCDIIS